MLLPLLFFSCFLAILACVLLKTKWQLINMHSANIIMIDLEELSDSSTSSGDENVEEDPIVVAENSGEIFHIPGGAAIARKRKEVKQLLVQVPGTV